MFALLSIYWKAGFISSRVSASRAIFPIFIGRVTEIFEPERFLSDKTAFDSESRSRPAKFEKQTSTATNLDNRLANATFLKDLISFVEAPYPCNDFEAFKILSKPLVEVLVTNLPHSVVSQPWFQYQQPRHAL